MAKWIAAEEASNRAGLRQGEGSPKASGLVLVRSPLLTSYYDWWRELVSSGRFDLKIPMIPFSGVTFV